MNPDELQALLDMISSVNPAAGASPGLASAPVAAPGGGGAGGGLGSTLLTLLLGSGGGTAGGTPGLLSGDTLQQVLALITALGGGQYGADQLNALKNIYQQQQKTAAMAMNPALLSKRALEATLPLNRNLQYQLTSAGEAAAANAGMGQSPGAVAGAVAREFAPYAEQNLQLGEQNATFGFPFQFARRAPDYISVLNELNSLGKNSGPYALPAGTP